MEKSYAVSMAIFSPLAFMAMTLFVVTRLVSDFAADMTIVLVAPQDFGPRKYRVGENEPN
jgi:hypothetical protein